MEVASGGPDYDYLVGMAMWSLTEEKKNELLKKRDDKQAELKRLQNTTKEQLWQHDLDAFTEKLEEVEAIEREEDATSAAQGGKKDKKSGKAGKGRMMKQEALPSPMGIRDFRVVPRVGDDLKIKAAKAVAAKERKGMKKERKAMREVLDEKDEFDMMTEDREANKSLTEKLGTTPDKIVKGKKMKQTKLAFKKMTPKKGKVRNPWSDYSDVVDPSGSDLSNAIADEPVIPRERAGGRRADVDDKSPIFKGLSRRQEVQFLLVFLFSICDKVTKIRMRCI